MLTKKYGLHLSANTFPEWVSSLWVLFCVRIVVVEILMHSYICMYIYLYVFIFLYLYVFIFVCMYVYLYVCMFVCMYVCMYVYLCVKWSYDEMINRSFKKR